MITDIVNLPKSSGLMPLSRGAYAIVDTELLRLLNLHRWSLMIDRFGSRYARRFEKGRTIYMHREIMDSPNGMEIDHINGNGLDNRKINLRVCTRSQNRQNSRKRTAKSSPFKGVDWYKRDLKWRARIKIKGLEIYLGVFESEIEAAEAYDKKAIELFGEFANTNFKDFSDGNTDSNQHTHCNLNSFST